MLYSLNFFPIFVTLTPNFYLSLSLAPSDFSKYIQRMPRWRSRPFVHLLLFTARQLHDFGTDDLDAKRAEKADEGSWRSRRKQRGIINNGRVTTSNRDRSVSKINDGVNVPCNHSNASAPGQCVQNEASKSVSCKATSKSREED